MVRALLTNLTLSFSNALSTFLTMYLPLGVLMLLFSLTLTGIMSLVRHRREKSTFTVIRKDQKEVFFDHLNSIHNGIQFTSEDPSEDGSIPFLDMLVLPDQEGRLKTTVYRKPTHTNQYLHWDSHHAIPSKYSMIGTLFHRAKTICSGPTQLQEEEEHLYRTLKRCKYPTWALNRVKLRNQTTSPQEEQ